MVHTIEFNVFNYDELKDKIVSFENEGYIFISALSTTTNYYVNHIAIKKVSHIVVKMEKEENI